MGKPRWHNGKESTCHCRRCKKYGFDPHWKWQSVPILLLGKSYGQRSLVGYSTWGHKRVTYNWEHKHKTENRESLLKECRSTFKIYVCMKTLTTATRSTTTGFCRFLCTLYSIHAHCIMDIFKIRIFICALNSTD